MFWPTQCQRHWQQAWWTAASVMCSLSLFARKDWWEAAIRANMTATLAYVKKLGPKEEQHPGLRSRTEPRMPRSLDDAAFDLSTREFAWLTCSAWQSVRRQWHCGCIDLQAWGAWSGVVIMSVMEIPSHTLRTNMGYLFDLTAPRLVLALSGQETA